MFLACVATVSTDTAKNADSSASGVLDAADWVATAAILARYPSSESIIWLKIAGSLLLASPCELAVAVAVPPKG